MRHHVDHRKLGRTSAHRKAMLANMVSSLILHNRIETTLPKAKELRRIADRVVTLSKKGTVAARRRAMRLVKDGKAVTEAFSAFAQRFSDRNGGYTRIYRLGFRHGDSAPMAIIEYLKGTAEEKEAGAARPSKASGKKGPAAKRKASPTTQEKKASPKKSASKKSPSKKPLKKKTASKKKTSPKGA